MAKPIPLTIITDEFERRAQDDDDLETLISEMCQEIRTLRYLLCLNYAKHPYTDDGELQDNYWPPIDFNRDSLSTIQKRMHDRAINALLKKEPVK